jgi:hypothetical protein
MAWILHDVFLAMPPADCERRLKRRLAKPAAKGSLDLRLPVDVLILWFEQVLQQHVTPNIPGLNIRHVPLSKGLVAVVIDIPATTGDPHQVSDGRYHPDGKPVRSLVEYRLLNFAIKALLGQFVKRENNGSQRWWLLVRECECRMGKLLFGTVVGNTTKSPKSPNPRGLC